VTGPNSTPGPGPNDADRLERARRIDWRLLLPDPSPGRVGLAGEPDARLAAALTDAGWEPVALDEARAAHDGPGDTSGLDLVVAVAPTARGLVAGIGAVRPGGWLYAECHGLATRRGRRGALGPAVVVARLRRAGFDPVRLQVQAPAGAPKVIVPIDGPAALRLFLERRRGMLGRAPVVAGLELARRAGLVTRLAPLVSVVARRPGAEAGGPVRDAVSEHLDGLAPARHGPASPAPLLLTPRFKASANVIALVPGENPREPAIVVKVARHGGAGEAADREAAALRALHDTAAGPRDGPRLIDIGLPWGLPTIVETAVPGRPLAPAVVAADPERALTLGLRWLVSLVGGADSSTPAGGRLDRLVCPQLDRYVETIAATEDEGRLVAVTRSSAAFLRGVALPRVMEHGDASHPNLIELAEGRLTAVDWELGEADGLPGHDLSAFLAYVAIARAGARTPAAQGAAVVDAALGGAGWADRTAAAYAAAAGIDPAILPRLAAIAWARQVMGLVDRLHGGPAATVTRDVKAWLAGHRYVAAWRAAVETVERAGEVAT